MNNSAIHLTYKRLSARFDIATLERHWDRIVEIVRARRASC